MQKAKIIAALIGAVALMAVALFIFASLRGPTYDYLSEGDIIVGIGDSITAGGKTNEDFEADGEGYVNNLGDGYFKLVADGLRSEIDGLTFYNSARSGTDATGWIERVYYHALDFNPQLIIMTLGANDFLFDTPQRYYEGIENTCYAIHKSGISAIVVLPFCFDHYASSDIADNPKDAAEMKEYVDVAIGVAEKYNFVTVDIGAIFDEYIENGTDPKELSEDGIHPTDFGEEILAQAVLEAIEKL